MIFVTVFILAFMASDYMITGSVTETWMAIAVVAGVLSAILRWFISVVLVPLMRLR